MSNTLDPALLHQLRSFALFLTELAEGDLHRDLTDEHKALVLALRESAAANGGKASGSLTLKLGIKCDRGAFMTTPEVKVAHPKRPPYALSVHFSLPDGTLTRQDPRQTSLALRDVSQPEARTVVG